MSPEDELRQRFEEVVAGLEFGDLRDVDAILAAISATGQRQQEATDERVSLRRPRRPDPATYTVHIELNHSSPPIWRRLALRSDLTLDAVHQVIQAAFGWQDYHLYRFAIGGDPFDRRAESFACAEDLSYEDEDEATPVSEVHLDEVLADPGDLVSYVYDFGDNWDVTISLESVAPVTDDDPARCLAGERAAPPEDCGGIRDADQLADVVADPSAFDIDEVNQTLHSPFAGFVDAGIRPEVVAFITRFRALPEGAAMLASVLQHDATTTEERARMLQPLMGYLRHIGTGLPLTAAGYLKPADLAVVAAPLPVVQAYPHRYTREVDCGPALDLRMALQRRGLLRKAKGVLSCTKAGLRAREDGDFLWHHLASRLLEDSDEVFVGQARIAGLLAIAAGADAPYTLGAEWMTMLGWAHGPRREPVMYYDLYEPLRSARIILTNLSVEPVKRANDQPTPVAMDLARASLRRPMHR